MQTDEAEEGQSDLDNDDVSGRKSFAVNRESLWVGGDGVIVIKEAIRDQTQRETVWVTRRISNFTFKTMELKKEIGLWNHGRRP